MYRMECVGGTYSENALPLIRRMAMAKARDWRTSWLERAFSPVLAGWAD